MTIVDLVAFREKHPAAYVFHYQMIAARQRAIAESWRNPNNRFRGGSFF